MATLGDGDEAQQEGQINSQLKKRLFDLAVVVVTWPLWVFVGLVCAMTILIFDGSPVFYVSERRTKGLVYRPIVKFRTMRRDAAKVANRGTVPVSQVRFLNISLDSPLFTSVGRVIERLALTEIPQFIHVLRGEMSLIGNRPLPEDVIESLREEFPYVDERFRADAGLTGPVQLVGREFISDKDRLMLEIGYCRVCREAYSFRLDLLILLNTVLLALGLRRLFTVFEAEDMMIKYSRGRLRSRQ